MWFFFQGAAAEQQLPAHPAIRARQAVQPNHTRSPREPPEQGHHDPVQRTQRDPQAADLHAGQLTR